MVEVEGLDVGGMIDGRTIDIRIITMNGDAGGGLVHLLTVRDREGETLSITRAESRVPGSTTLITEDEGGRPQVITRAELDDGTRIEVVAGSAGDAVHRLIRPSSGGAAAAWRGASGGEITEAIAATPGAQTVINADGRVVTSVQQRCGGEVRALIEILPDGESATGYERFSEQRVAWEPLTPTLGPGSRFEAGHRIRLEGESCALTLRIETTVSRNLNF